MFEIKDETIYICSSELYRDIKEQTGVRDCQEDNRTLSVDDLCVRFKGCDFICEDNIPDVLYENID
jgi:hypothetical protein